jgi:hypothetical protein
MNKACLLIVVPTLLVALGFAQTPTAGSNSDPTSIKGCLGGSDGSYTFVEDNTGHNFKITTSTVDLKPHVGHDVTLVGQKASATATSGTVDNGFAVTSLNMISEHCAAAATATAPAASISTPADNAIPPPTDAAVPANTTAPADAAGLATAPAAQPTTITPPAAETAVTPSVAAPAAAAIAATPAETASAPAAVATTSDAKAPPETGVAPPAAAAHRTRLQADNRRPSATSATAPAARAEIVPAPVERSSTPVADAATLPATDSSASATASESAPAPAIPVATAKSASSWLWIPIIVVVLILGAAVPMLNRWRKRKLLGQSRAQNLSFSHRASSEPGTSDKPTSRKAA